MGTHKVKQKQASKKLLLPILIDPSWRAALDASPELVSHPAVAVMCKLFDDKITTFEQQFSLISQAGLSSLSHIPSALFPRSPVCPHLVTPHQENSSVNLLLHPPHYSSPPSPPDSTFP